VGWVISLFVMLSVSLVSERDLGGSTVNDEFSCSTKRARSYVSSCKFVVKSDGKSQGILVV
jgi:hypothetical protein